MAGLARRRLYKPERRPARTKGVLDKQAPIGLPNANKNEIALALFALAQQAGVAIGRGGSYDALRDEYTLTGKVLDGGIDAKGIKTGRVQDIKVQGAEVASVIKVARMMNGGRLVRTGSPR